MLHDMHRFEALAAFQSDAQAVLRDKMAMQHALHEAGLLSGTSGFAARLSSAVRRLGRQSAAQPVAHAGDAQAYGD